jgi:restriction system protein
MDDQEQEGIAGAVVPDSHIVRTPLFPLYSDVIALVRIFDGVSRDLIKALIKALYEQTGTPQSVVDWSQPNEWIGQRLSGDIQKFAKRIWHESKQQVNPRYIYGAYLFINTYGLLKTDPQETYHLSATGDLFLKGDALTVLMLDKAEGLPQLLAILANHSPARRGDLLDEWSEFLLQHSKFGKLSTFKDTLRRRLLNLVERGYISRSGNTYTITDQGIQYASTTSDKSSQQPHQAVLVAIKQYNATQYQALREKLETMKPYRFEGLVKELLEAMDYEDVVVTKQSGDKGVDVVARYQFGITQIKEVVQVKRHKGNITRPVLDQLRGVLPLHGAIRGTIITTGGFAKGCIEAATFPGASPITLVDGDTLIDLLVKHEVGIRKKQQTLIEIDDSAFADAGPEDQF